MKTFLSHVDK